MFIPFFKRSFVSFPTVLHVTNMFPKLHHFVLWRLHPSFPPDSWNSADLLKAIVFYCIWRQITHLPAETQNILNVIHQTQQNDIIEIEQYDTFQLKCVCVTTESRSTEIVCLAMANYLLRHAHCGRTNFSIPMGFQSSANAAFWLRYGLSRCWIRI